MRGHGEDVDASVKSSPRRRVGRPRGPERVAITVRIRQRNNERLTVAVDKTGKSPQYIVEEALDRYFDELGIGDPGLDQTA